MEKKAAYDFGVKLALLKMGLLETNQDPEHNNFTHARYPAEELASELRGDASLPIAPPTNMKKTEAFGEPENPNSTFSGSSTQSFGNDLLGRLGVDIRGPESTAI
jgi:hypothetical protein